MISGSAPRPKQTAASQSAQAERRYDAEPSKKSGQIIEPAAL